MDRHIRSEHLIPPRSPTSQVTDHRILGTESGKGFHWRKSYHLWSLCSRCFFSSSGPCTRLSHCCHRCPSVRMHGHKLCRHAIGGIPVLFTVGDCRKNPPEIDQAFESISALQRKGGLLGIRKDQRPVALV